MTQWLLQLGDTRADPLPLPLASLGLCRATAVTRWGLSSQDELTCREFLQPFIFPDLVKQLLTGSHQGLASVFGSFLTEKLTSTLCAG